MREREGDVEKGIIVRVSLVCGLASGARGWLVCPFFGGAHGLLLCVVGSMALEKRNE